MKCPRCGEDSPAPLTKHGCCYECASGHAAERHHVWGRANSPAVVEIPGNWHRALDAMRGERCEALKRPGIDPLHRIAAVAATIGESAAAFADHVRRWEWAPWLADLATIFPMPPRALRTGCCCSPAGLLIGSAPIGRQSWTCPNGSRRNDRADRDSRSRRGTSDWAAKPDLPQWEPPQR